MNDAEDSDQAGTNAGPNSPPPAPVMTSNDEAVLDESEAKRAEKEIKGAEELIRGTRVIEWLQLSVNALLVVFGIIAIFIYYGQLKVMRGQLGEIVKQYPEIRRQAQASTDAVKQAAADSVENSERVERQLKILQQQADAASKSAAAVQRQTEDSKTAMQVDQRPWVGLVRWDTDKEKAKNPFMVQGLSIVLRNSGKTPALKVRLECCYYIRLYTYEPIPDYDAQAAAEDQRERWNGKTLYPQGGVLAPGVLDRFTVPDAIPWGRVGDRRQLVIYVLGKVDYSDAFPGTHEHSTKFCLMGTSDTEFSACPENNWME
jgi:hypothetical protein